MKKPEFFPTFESLYEYECPDWFRDAKFGIWSHWGPQSVPMCGDWYARHMYVQDSPQYLYHVRHYGHPSKFGYKDICKLWKAENFDPDGLMALYHKSGARYFVGQAMHHDHFFNYASALNRMNSAQVGPMKDICALWRKAADRHDMPFGLSEHLGATFSWWKTNKWSDTYGPYEGVPYDGNDPEYRDFYMDNYEHASDRDTASRPWYTENPKHRAYWLAVIKEVVDRFTPDLLYTDGVLPFGEHWHETEQTTGAADNAAAYRLGLEAAAYLYNASIGKHGKNNAVYLQKDRRPEIYRVGILDIEKSQLPGIAERPWHTDTCIGNWFYDAKAPFKRPGHIIEMLVDIIAKNGTMLLNVLQRPDGTIDDEAAYILREIGAWFAICGQAVYRTRPYRVFGEGGAQVLIEGFREERAKWGPDDFRFTQGAGAGGASGGAGAGTGADAGGAVYAFMMKPDDSGTAVLRSFSDRRVNRVGLLDGSADGQKLEFAQNFGLLTVKLPRELPTKYVNCLKIQ
ncbi:MAG: alpha-L-fucosidase [Clostridiales bacterium]|jgi:alpha-L-fucosidase|nr:alpha-L-fucosidase [Clostridiales bacterium]